MQASKPRNNSKIRELWRSAERKLVSILPARRGNLLQMSRSGLWNDYFARAEGAMQWQWDTMIWPLIRDFNFHTTLELAPGAGRNTQKLCGLARNLHAVEYNASALRKCRKRLGTSFGGCEINYHRNNGTDLAMIGGSEITAIYCWDSAVHFERSIMESYVGEFARVLAPGGRGFVHHSNLGEGVDKNIKLNPHWRSNMSREAFAQMCEHHGLRVLTQADIPWDDIVDCASIFQKPLKA